MTITQFVARLFSQNPQSKHSNTTTPTASPKGQDFPIIRLPVDLLHLIKSFLPKKDFYNLLNTCKHPQIIATKARSILYNLPTKQSWRYFLNENQFRSRIESTIFNKALQLSLDFADLPGLKPRPVIRDTSLLSNLRHLRLCDVEMDASLLSEIRHVKRLQVERFPLLVFMPKIDSTVEEIVIKDMPLLVDVSSLAGMEKVTIVYCPKLEDISALGGCIDLTIRSCGKIEDISMLGGQKQLSLSYCHKIENIDHLSSVNKVIITECEKIRDYGALTNVEDLTISGTIERLPEQCHAKRATFKSCRILLRNDDSSCFFDSIEKLVFDNYLLSDSNGFPKFSSQTLRDLRCIRCSFQIVKSLPLQNLQRLELTECNFYSDLSIMGHIPVLILRGCYSVESLEGLGGSTQRHVIIETAIKVTHFDILQYVKRVEIINCWKFQRISDLKFCEEIVIGDCNSTFVDTEPLSSNCVSIKVFGCKGLSSIHSFQHVPNIEVTGCNIPDMIVKGKRLISSL